MAFDSRNAVQVAALKTELTTDPRAYGYAALLAAGNQTGLMNELNQIRDGTDGALISLNRGFISAQELVEAIVQSEMPASANQRDWLIMVCSGSRVRVDLVSTARAGLLAIFGAGTTTRTNLTAVSSRPSSRFEELFGIDGSCGLNDVSTALAS